MMLRSTSASRSQRGFTLIEMLWVLAIIGILLMLTDFGSIARLNSTYYATRQEANNRNIVSALLQYAKTSTAHGTLPAPYTGGSYNNTILDTSNTTLAQILRSASMAPTEINDDGTSAQNVRVYQMVTLTQATPLDFQSGPLTTLTYQYGEIHQTLCQLSDTSCNRALPNIPGASTPLTTANYKTWATVSTDLSPTFFSTLPLQKQMLVLTSQRLSALRDQFIARVNTKRASAAATDTTNWFPYPYAVGVPGTPNPDLSGAAAASTGLGCWDGWYDLSNASVNVLAQLGLSQSQYGTTAWGGRVEYCRDYDPALRGANSLPHYGALRIHQSVSLASNPTTTSSDNLVISF